MRVDGAAELRVKESDRISCLATGLRGARRVGRGVSRRVPARVASAHGRHGRRRRRSPAGHGVRDRRAPAPPSPTTILGASSVAVSYPGFFRRARAADAVTADKIYLVGFMAAGKTTVARALAARLGWRAEDVDELIEARERRPVADIFSRAASRISGRWNGRFSRSCCRCATSSWPLAEEPSSSRRTAAPSTSTACRCGSTCRSTSCSRVCRPTAGGRWPPTAARWSACLRRAASRTPGAPANRCRRGARR